MSRILPILFNTDMVRAILDGRKTVTRRILKLPKYVESQENGLYTLRADGCSYCDQQMEEITEYIKKPCQPGDILYIRESYHPNYFDIDTGWGNNHAYKADYEAVRGEIPEPKWTPSIHMPKEAARIWLKVTDVRVERLQDITEEQARAEGFIDNRGMIHSPDNEYDRVHSAREHFIDTFLNLYPDCSLDTWVWVYEFERCEKPE